MIQKKILLLTAALSLLMSTVHTGNAQPATSQAAKSATTIISALPYTITTPGTYVLTADLICSSTQAAVLIPTYNLSGSVVLDLKGHTITGGGNYTTGVYITGPSINAFPITVRNGTIKNVSFCVWADGLSNITIANLSLFTVQPPEGVCVIFSYVENSTVSNCSFNNATYGITDESSPSPGGNLFRNITFNNVVVSLYITAAQGGVLERCQFAPPAK
jgi:hypothetical protein